MDNTIVGDDALIRLLYFSRASAEVRRRPEPMMHEILAQAVPNNAKAELTGALLYCDGWFVQALEGVKHCVGGAFGRIDADRRHEAVTQISAGQIEARAFGAWSMCVAALSPTDAAIVQTLTNGRKFQPDLQPPTSILRLLKAVAAIKDRESVTLI